MRAPPPPIFISKEGMATFWFVVAAGAVLWAAFTVYRAAVTAGLRPQYILMASEYVKPFPFELAPDRHQELHTLQTRMLMDSLFNKSPNGLDAAERARRVLTDDAWKWVNEQMIEKQKEAFSQGRIHQKVEIESISLNRAPDDSYTSATVKAQLLRAGIANAKVFNEVWAVQTTFKWERNGRLRDCARYPIVCSRVISSREVLQSSTLQRVPGEDEPAAAAPSAQTEEPTAN